MEETAQEQKQKHFLPLSDFNNGLFWKAATDTLKLPDQRWDVAEVPNLT